MSKEEALKGLAYLAQFGLETASNISLSRRTTVSTAGTSSLTNGKRKQRKSGTRQKRFSTVW